MANLDYGINNKQEKIIKLQRRVSIIMIVYISKIIWIFKLFITDLIVFLNTIAGFIFSWLPYAIVTLYSAFVNPSHITPLGSTLSAIFAKSSLFLSSMFYIFSNKNFKSKINSNFKSISDRNSNFEMQPIIVQ